MNMLCSCFCSKQPAIIYYDSFLENKNSNANVMFVLNIIDGVTTSTSYFER